MLSARVIGLQYDSIVKMTLKKLTKFLKNKAPMRSNRVYKSKFNFDGTI